MKVSLALFVFVFFVPAFAEDALKEVPPRQGHGKDSPERWILEYASTGLDFKGGRKFVLETDAIPNDATSELVTKHQDVFMWHQSFGSTIRSNSQKMDFALLQEGELYDFTAYKSNDFMTGEGSYGEEQGKFAWQGIVKDSKGGDDQGELTCSFGWGQLDCSVWVSDESFDGVYRITMEEDIMYVGKTLKSELQQNFEPDEEVDETNTQNPYDVVESEHNGETLDENGELHFDDDEALGSPGPEVRALKATYKPNDATDVIIFYTDRAATKYGSSSALEQRLEVLIAQWNAALNAKGVTAPEKFLNLVATWQLFDSDTSDYMSWAGNTITTAVREAFYNNQVLNERRSLVGADTMVMVDIWDVYTDGYIINGIAHFGSHESVVRVGALSGVTLQHEIAHTFNILHCHGDVYYNNGWKATTMAYQRSGNVRINEWSDKTVNYFKTESAADYTQTGVGGDGNCNNPPGEHCCSATGTQLTMSPVWDYQTSKGAIRINPGTSGDQRQYAWRTCLGGFDSIGLYQYHESNDYEKVALRVQCGSNYYMLGATGSTPSATHTLRCNNGVKPGGFALYRYKRNGKDWYAAAVYCPGQGWIYTTAPSDAQFISFDWTGYWKTAAPEKQKLAYIKWNRYNLGSDGSDTYNMDVAFD